MPELPEVETVRRFLEGVLLKPKPKKIKYIYFYYPPIVKEVETSQFAKILIGQHFGSIDRYGKFLILKLSHICRAGHRRSVTGLPSRDIPG